MKAATDTPSPPWPPAPGSPGQRLQAFILLQAVADLERERALDDSEAMRAAHAASRDPEARLLARAAWLAREQGLAQELARWRGRAVWLLLAAALLVALMSHSLVLAVVGQDRRINAVAAWVAVLGPHLAMLGLWLFGLWHGGGGGLPRWGLELLSRLPGIGGESSRRLLRAMLELLGRSGRLLPWAFGLLSHLMWATAFGLTLGVLAASFAFQSYRLGWETTILDASFFSAFSQAVGWLPGQLGLATPDPARLLAGLDDHRGWALWLLGSTLVYGLLPRVALSALSLWRLRRQLGALHIDPADPTLRLLLNRFAAMDTPRVIDAEARPATTASAASAAPVSPGQGLALLGYELPPESPWPPPALQPLLERAALQQRLDGGPESRAALEQRLATLRPRRLLVLLHADASPDRGTARFLRGLLPRAQQAALLLQGGAPERAAAVRRRWQDWLDAETLAPAALFFDAASARTWMLDEQESAHD